MNTYYDLQKSSFLHCHYDLIYDEIYQTGYGIAFVFCDEDEDYEAAESNIVCDA